MTSYPNPNPSYYPQPMAQPLPPGVRPGSVTALAIIGIIFGGGGLLCKPIMLAANFIQPPGGPNPMADMQKQLIGWFIVETVIGVAISALLLAGSIGSLSLKPWARKAMLVYAVAAIVMTVVDAAVGFIYVLPRMHEAQAQMVQQQSGRNRGGPPPQQMVNIVQTAGTVGFIVGAAARFIFPVVLFYFFTRPNVVGAFEGGAGAAPPGGPYGGYPAAPVPGGYYAPPPPGPYPQQ
jgi:hypothetical protein